MSVLTFDPIYQARIWGGDALARHFQRALPADQKIGESWELVDRPEACSVIASGSERWKNLHELWQERRTEFFGRRAPQTERFPILIKLLDCAETLSVQVHPPEKLAKELNGEPKTEMWYFLQTAPGAMIYAGLKAGVGRRELEAAIGTPRLAELLHTLPTAPSEAMFLPSGRVHAIGAGNLILEIQQNSDTTYRVDDWGRVDAKTGLPRELHIQPALASINYEDHAPILTQSQGDKVVECVYFCVRRNFLYPGEFRSFHPAGETFQYQFVAQGTVQQGEKTYAAGSAWLVTANEASYDLVPGENGAEVVTVEFPSF